MKFSYEKALEFFRKEDISAYREEIIKAHEKLHNKTGEGKEYVGFVDLPSNYDFMEFSRIKTAAKKIRSDSDVLVVIGIGGSYLGARAAIEFLNGPMYNYKQKTRIFFAGTNLSGAALADLLTLVENKELSINVISKSGTTIEPAIAFRLFKRLMESKYGKEGAKSRIYVTTDKEKGALKELADKEGYECFVVPDNIGGRYSVLSAVGLLPIAASGANIDKLMQGASDARSKFMETDLDINECYQYAIIRNILLGKGKNIEILASYEPSLHYFGEWWKQLFGESEGKQHKGIYPASVDFTTDLHSLGQYIQQGQRQIFETVLNIVKPPNDILIQEEEGDPDGLNFLAGRSMSDINNKAFLGTMLAHTDGEVPNLVVHIDEINEYNLGFLIYFFEKACGISGYLLGVNPFDQPGVEEYKNNMYALLGKPGYEELAENLNEKL